jgi:hypothetical protein
LDRELVPPRITVTDEGCPVPQFIELPRASVVGNSVIKIGPGQWPPALILLSGLPEGVS